MNRFNLADIIRTKTRFGRSVNLERDFYSDESLEGYVLTTTSLNSLERLTKALKSKSATRAWTLTGAFGSGKSTFALFAAKVFNHQDTADFSSCEKLIKQRSPHLWQTVFENPQDAPQFFPILISGSREPLAKAILRGAKSALQNSELKKSNLLFAGIEKLEASLDVTGKQVLELFAEISKAVNKNSEKRIGLLVVIDELGKLLEYAALHPGESDIFLLQELAEATRKTDVPFFLMTILHQAFERYAERLGRREREEWTKIQGRFEDLPFQEPNEQVLHVLQSVFEQDKKSPNYKTLNDYGVKLANTAYDLGLCGLLERREAVSLLRDCLPLHPTVAVALGSVFRRFGQNERSLFAFLTSNEPFGTSEFLKTTIWNEEKREVIRLDRVYDYIVSAMGSALYTGADGRKWAEIDTAIHRVANPTELEIRLLKTIGLLYLLGDAGNLKNSPRILHFALADEQTSESDIDSALESLQNKSIVTFRRFNDTFVVWEGSDLNLDDRFREAERQIDQGISLAENLTRYFRPRPVVAKRHSYRTGTLRYFEVVYKNADDLDSILSERNCSTDGRIVFALAANDEEFAALQSKIQTLDFQFGLQTIVALPRNLNNLRDAVRGTVCWRWVQANTPELETDRAARNELSARVAHAEQTVLRWIEDWMANAASENCLWFWQNEPRQIVSPRVLQDFLSTVFDTVFPDTPVLKNELINRQTLSGAATSARRALFEAMLEKADSAQLGIEGFPPQISMYFSLLQNTTIHREENGKFGFFPPNENADKGIQAGWSAIENFLNETENQRLTVAELFARLQSPPFGLKSGILPILLVAVLLYMDAEVAVYERGNFLPKLSLPIFERLCRAPEAFTLQLCRIAGVRVQVLGKMANVLLPDLKKERAVDVLTIVRPLARFAQELEDYTQHTARLSKTALDVRRALFSAREPDKLIFKSLPEACGMKEFIARDENTETVEEFSHRLHAALAELKRAYSELLNEIEAMLVNAFSLAKSNGREELNRRTQNAAEFVSSARLKGFILRATDTELEQNTWLESIAALLAGKPPAVWRDEDLAKFEIGLAETARAFTNLESLVIERNNQLKTGETDFELVRLSLTQMKTGEAARVLSIRPEDREKIERTEQLLLKAFEQSPMNGDANLRLAVLANLSLKILNQEK